MCRGGGEEPECRICIFPSPHKHRTRRFYYIRERRVHLCTFLSSQNRRPGSFHCAQETKQKKFSFATLANLPRSLCTLPQDAAINLFPSITFSAGSSTNFPRTHRRREKNQTHFEIINHVTSYSNRTLETQSASFYYITIRRIYF